MTRIKTWWWSLPGSQRTALILGPLAVIAVLYVELQ